MFKFWPISFIIVRYWVNGFDRILGTNENWGKWWDIIAVMLPDIISGRIKLENILPMRVFEWLVILVGHKTYGIKELEASESKKSVGGW